jgi:small subunit ribosomal protein S1
MPRDDDTELDEGSEDFARMLEDSLEPRTFSEGEMVEGPIVALGDSVAFVDVGGKGEATIDLEELVDAEGDHDVRVGDVVQAVVVSTTGGLKLSHKLARGAANRQRLEDAFHAGLPVEGRVDKVIKGGYEVRFAGQRAFCPISQIDNHYTTDPSVHEGQVYTFRILELKEGGKDLVVSRRALLEEEEREKAEEVRRTIVPGATLTGRVASVRSFGAFIDLGGGVQGLLHVSEMAWTRVQDASAVVQAGDEVTVKVLDVDDDKGRIALGLKQLQTDPWAAAADTYEVGQALQGRVTRLAEFGAFVELEPGIEALAHVSTFAPSKTRDGWKAEMSPGTDVAVEIVSFDPERKRIGVAVLSDRSAKATEKSDVREFVERQERTGSEGFGSLADTLREAIRKREK